jgi:hypothetical protein
VTPGTSIKTKRRDGLAFPLEGEGSDRLDRDRVSHEAVGAISDQGLPRLRRVLEPRGDVDRVSGCEPLPAKAVTSDDLARVDTDTHVDVALTGAVSSVLRSR